MMQLPNGLFYEFEDLPVDVQGRAICEPTIRPLPRRQKAKIEALKALIRELEAAF